MTPTHHPDSDALLAYAAGTTSEWLSLVIACHLTYCPHCRDEVAWCEEVGGALLDKLERVNGGVAGKGALPSRPRAETSRLSMPDARLPRPLGAYFTESTPKWLFLAPGVRNIPLSIDANGRVLRVVEFRPGYVIPEHSHSGGETLVIFRGSLKDSRDHAVYARGDVCRSESGSMHVQTIGAEEPCVSLVVNEGPLVPTSLFGRILQKLTGI